MNRDYHRNYSRKYYHKRRNELLSKLGGKCVKCGSTEHLEFDHINSVEKRFNISDLLNRSKQETETELQKCQLLCHSCHTKKSNKELKETRKGEKNPFYGKHGKENHFSKPVIDLDTGKEFESATDFASYYGLIPVCVERVARGERKSIHGHHVKYK